jgi:ADP-ribose pyrophosphatase YjhB (NUDIX family)
LTVETRQVFATYGRPSAGEAAQFCLACGSSLPNQHHGTRPHRACAACGYIRYLSPSPGVSVLITDGDRFLLCRRRPEVLEGGKWCLPCGYVEYDEDFLTAARREVQEETGLVVEITSIISVSSNFLRRDVHTLVTVLLARKVGGLQQPGDDIDLVQWFSSTDELPPLAFEADEHIIERYFATRFEGAPVEQRAHATGGGATTP